MTKILLAILTLGISYTPSYKTIAKKANTPENMEYYLTYFEYKKDKHPLDSWQTPFEFYEAGGDDCEGFAVFIYEILKSHGYRCRIYVLKKESNRHAIVTYKKDREYGMFSNATHYPDIYGIKEILLVLQYDDWQIVNWQIKHKLVRRTVKESLDKNK